jgi:DNA topoisomerase-2
VGVAVVPDCGFQSVSFVNGICTQRGGTHVTAVADALVKKLLPYISKKVTGALAAACGL